MKYSSIIPAINFFKSVKVIYKKPIKTNILIFDRVGSLDLAPYFKDIKYEVLDVRGESINLYILFITLIKYIYNTTFKNYVDEYIKYSKPSCVITFIDNTEYFYKLKKYNPNIYFISIQNGWRDQILFEILKKNISTNNRLESDYLFCFGEAVGFQYSQLINTKFYPYL